MVLSKPGWTIYREQMGLFHCGDALWEPAPNDNYERVKLGDVGHIRRGRFHLLFSAGCPLGSRRRGDDVPETFEPLDVGPIIRGQPRSPGCIGTSTTKEPGADIGPSVSATPTMKPGASLTFEFTERQGAALVTKCRTFREDVDLEAAFEEYTKRHYNSWVAFARSKQYGNDIKPVLVTGVDMTRDFAMMAYSSNSARLSSKFTISDPLLTSASGSAWGRWETRGLVHTNCGPQLRTLSLLSDELGAENSGTGTGDISKEFNQCVFVRYYTMRWRAFMFPKVMKAAAGPHDLGDGDNHDEAHPELMVQSVPDSSAGFAGGEDSVMSNHFSSVTSDDPELEPFHNVSSEERDIFDVIAEYVFRNSEAEAVIVHHRDMTQTREGTFAGGMSEILSERQPAIELDGNRVGRLVPQTQQQPTVPSSLEDVTEPDTIRHRPDSAGTKDDFFDAILERLNENLTRSAQVPEFGPQGIPLNRPTPGTNIPQRLYCQGTAIPEGETPQIISFAVAHGGYFPAELALAGQCNLLVDGNSAVFTEQNQTINLRIEWPGYGGWGAQIRTVNYKEKLKSITRAKLVTEIAKQLLRFIEISQSVPIDPAYAMFKVGPGGIELRYLHIASLERVSGGSWQPRFIYSGP